MPIPRRLHRSATVVGVVLALTLPACSGLRSPVGTGTAAREGRYAGDSAAAEPDRLRIQRASMGVEVEDLPKSVAALQTLASDLDGHVANEVVQKDASATLSLRVPADRLPEAMERAAALGEVTHRRVDSRDVTDEVADLDAKRQNLASLRDRLRKLLDRAESVEDVLRVERELTRVQTELDTLDGRLARLRTDVALAQLEVTLTQQRPKRILGPLGYLYVGVSWFVEKLFVIRPGEP